MSTKFIFKNVFLLIFLLGNYPGNSQEFIYDLAIKNVVIFNSKTKKFEKFKTILIKNDTIGAIIKSSQHFKAYKTIEGHKRLVCAGFIDTHTHLKNVYGKINDQEKGPVYLDRKKLADTYLKFGTTTIVDMGQPGLWIDTTLNWQKNPSPEYPDIFISGGAMVSEEPGRKTYMNHVVVKSPVEARQQVEEYANKGIRHIKLYWRLREPEMKAVIQESDARHLTVSAHIDNNVTSLSDAMNLGVKNLEHLLTLPPEIIDVKATFRSIQEQYGIKDDDNVDEFLARILLFFNYIKEHPDKDIKMKSLLDKMVVNDISLSTSIHFMGSLAGKTYFNTSLSDNDEPDLSDYTAEQMLLLEKSFDVMMSYLKYAHAKGLQIRIGTDCKDGGKAMLSELMLLREAGFSIADILQIATINGARAMKIDQYYGSIEKGKKANLILFLKNPCSDYRNFLVEKIIIKDGQIYNQ